MPRNNKKEKPDFKTIVANKMVEKPTWKAPRPPFGTAPVLHCNCWVSDDGSACSRGCVMKEQRWECLMSGQHKCTHGDKCTNNVIQKRSYYPTERINCGGKGGGLVFTKDVPENTVALNYVGEVISMATARKRSEFNKGKHTYFLEITAGWVIDARDYGNESRFINSSHEPNAVFETWWVRNTPHVVVRTLRLLRAGEEILVDYNFGVGDQEICLCNTPSCTGLIGKQRAGTRPEDPIVFDDEAEVPEVQPIFSRGARSTLKRYSLKGAKVLGDGHCLFHSAAKLDQRFSFRGWRTAVADDMVEYCNTEERRRVYLHRANNDVRAGRIKFKTFEEMIEAFRTTEWGNQDCIRHLARLMGRGFVVFTQGSIPSYTAWGTDAPTEIHILYNSTCPVTGKLVHFDPAWPEGEPSAAFTDLLQELRQNRERNLADDNIGHVEIESDEEIEAPPRARAPAARAASSTSYVRSSEETAELHGGGSASGGSSSRGHARNPLPVPPDEIEQSFLLPIVDQQPDNPRRSTTVNRRSELNVFSEPFVPDPRFMQARARVGILPDPTGTGTRTGASARTCRPPPERVKEKAQFKAPPLKPTSNKPDKPFDPTRLIFRDKKQPRKEMPARSHWGLMYFMYKMQDKRKAAWDLNSLASMALHPKISRSAAASLWEIGWQELTDDNEIPDMTTEFDHMDPENMLSLWWSSHMWASELEEGTRRDLVMAVANTGPVGIWPSLHTTVKEFANQRAGIVLLEDIRVSKRGIPSLRSTLNFVYPQYHVIISSHSMTERSSRDNTRRPYHYAVCTMLHRHLYTGITTESICGKDKGERRAVLGHALVVSAYCKPLERKVVTVNLYQHTASHPQRQQVLYDCVGRFVRKLDLNDVSLIGGGDLNAAFPGQRWDYTSDGHARSDQVLQDFADKKLVHFESPKTPTFWDQRRAARAVLDHVFSGDGKRAKLSVVPRHSWHPSHDHANVYVWADTAYLPARPAVGAYRPPAPRIRMRSWEQKRPEWADLSKKVLDDNSPSTRLDMPPTVFEKHFKDVIVDVVAAGIDLVGRATPGTNRPAFRTKEVSQMVREGRVLTAAKRETHVMQPDDTRFTAAQRKALTLLDIPIPTLPISHEDLDNLRDRLRTAHRSKMDEIKKETREMERTNINECIERVRKDLGKERFTVQKALGKTSASGTLDVLEQRVPVGLSFSLNKIDLERELREHNLEEVAVWITETSQTRSEVRAPSLKLVLPLLTRVPLYVKPDGLLWETRTAQEDQDKLWVMDHHYQQISYAKKARCPCCDGGQPVALPLRMNGEIGTVDYCQHCFRVSEFAARSHEYEDLSFLGKVTKFRTVPEGERLAGRVTFEEFTKYLKKLKEKKAAGVDKFHVEFLKHAHTDLQKFVHHLVNLYLEQTLLIDEDFLLGEIRLLFKKEPATNLRNWRPVCLLQMIYKLVAVILNDRLYVMAEKYHLLEGTQEGFRKARGTGRQGQSLTWLFDRARRNGGKLYCVYADFVSAFDSPDHPALLRALKAYGIPDVDLLASLYRASPFRVSTPFGETCDIRVGRGCRQGCVLSPLVFDLFVNLLLRHLNASGVGAQITDRRTINHKAFADDVGMVVNSPAAAQNLLDRLAAFCRWSGMEVNMLKTQATAIDFSTMDIPSDLLIESTTEAHHLSNRRSKARDVCSLTFDGERIDFVPPSSPFCYLGYDLTLTGSWSAEVARIKRKTVQLCEVLDKHKYTESQGLYLFQCSAISTFRYSIGVAAWSDKDLFELTLLWVRAFKNALHLSRSVARSLVLYPREQGGMQRITPFTVGFKELGAHLSRCATYQDSLSLQLDSVIQHALDSTLTNDLADLQSEARSHPGLDISNTILRWVHLAKINGVTVEWDRVPTRPGAVSWAAALSPIRDTDVHWHQDADMLRCTARALTKQGYSNVLKLPISGDHFRIPYGTGYNESARSRLEQWLGRTLRPMRPMDQEVPAVALQRNSRSKIEILAVANELMRDVPDFSSDSISDYMHYLSLSLQDNAAEYAQLHTAVVRHRPRSWRKLTTLLRATLFPPESTGPRPGQRDALDWDQIRRHADVLYRTALNIRRHNNGQGWEVQYELSGRTIAEAEKILELPDTKLKRLLIQQRRPILLPPEWWPDESPPTVWGWWTLPVAWDENGVTVRCMERKAILDRAIHIPLRGDGSIEHALRHMCLSQPPKRWVQFIDLGVPLRKPRVNEQDASLPASLLGLLQSRGPLTSGELLQGGRPTLYRRYLKRAQLPAVRPLRAMYNLHVEPDELDDDSVISDPSRLLQYHVSRFRRATKSPWTERIATPSVQWGNSRAAGVDIRTHSYLDGAPPRLDPALVSVQAQSKRYVDQFTNFQATTYQGVARIEDALGGWDLDAMRLHQIKADRPQTTSQGIREHRLDIQRDEKRGYRTVSWTVMHQISTVLDLDTSLGEPLFGSYPSLHPVTSLFSVETPTNQPSSWLFLDAVPPLMAMAWCDRFLRSGGGVIASTTLRNMTEGTRDFLRLKANAYGMATAPHLLREKGWWSNGDTKTNRARKTLHLWLFMTASKTSRLPGLLKWITTASSTTLPLLGVGGRAWSYWSGSEAGRLGLYDGSINLLATDGSATDAALGAGYTMRQGGQVSDWSGYVEGADEQVTSFRPEAAALLSGLRAAPREKDFAGLVDNESLLTVTDSWIGSSHHPAPGSIADADLILPLIREIGLRTGRTTLFKLKSHRGEPYNTRADRLADIGAGVREDTVQRVGPRRILFQVPGYRGLWNNKVSSHAENTVAKIFLARFNTGVLDSFLARQDVGRRFLGDWFKRHLRQPGNVVRVVIQIVTDTYPSPAKLFMWGRAASAACTECGFPFGTSGHIQCHCDATKGARIEAHNKCRKLITECITKHARGWKTYPETSVEDTIALIQRNTGIRIPPMPDVSFFDPKLQGSDGTPGQWRILRWSESSKMRIDELAIHRSSRKIRFNEMTRAWDREDSFADVKHKFKTAWYRPVIQYLSDQMATKRWTVEQFNFTIGARSTLPEPTWATYLDEYKIPKKHQQQLMADVVDSVLQSLADIAGVFSSHRTTRLQARSS